MKNIMLRLASLLLGTAVAFQMTAGETTVKTDSPKSPRYIFYFIGDGMGVGPVMAAQTYLRTVKSPSRSLNMTSFPVWSFIQTYSANTPVTDSAAAGTALSTGVKTKNGMLGMNPDTVAVTSVAKILKDKGYGVGIITTVAPDDATPGAFYTHVPHRSMFKDIDLDMARSGYEFIAGAGLRGLTDKEGKSTGVLDTFASREVQIVRGPSEIGSISSQKVLVLNPEGTPPNDMGYTIDSLDDVLNLPMLTSACISHLEKYSPDKFFMMVEGGNIDHALHANDAGAAIKEVVNFDEALGIALDFYRKHPDETLILVTADHDTGGLALGNNYVRYNVLLQYIDSQKMSKERFSDWCKSLLKSRRTFRWEDMKEELSSNFGLFTVIPVSEKDEKKLEEMFEEIFEKRNEGKDEKTLYGSFNAFSVEVAHIIDKATGIDFTTTSHTGNPVPFFAIGCGMDRFKAIGNNDKVAPAIIELVEVE